MLCMPRMPSRASQPGELENRGVGNGKWEMGNGKWEIACPLSNVLRTDALSLQMPIQSNQRSNHLSRHRDRPAFIFSSTKLRVHVS